MSTRSVDITPTPRILRTLGDIPLPNWRCLAELTDNSLDAFEEARKAGTAFPDAKIDILWSQNEVPDSERTIEVRDNGPGMTLETLQNAARAGYSSHNPIENLGLFGMGFNIATARLGDKTRLLSTTKGSAEWIGIEIDFAELIRSGTFNAPTITQPKTDPDESGTQIIITKLKEGVHKKLRQEETDIRKQLERIYTTILSQRQIEVCVRNKKLSPLPHCTWASSRYVFRKGREVYARVDVDRDLGTALFDQQRNRYLTRDEEVDILDPKKGSVLPSYVVRRHKRLTGWLGIQRYADTNDFGIDFVRNGRKILLGDKSLFSYVNPLTGTTKLEYPVELGTTQGGRIVGELNVDYLLPSYQKNDFDRNDPSWDETVAAVRGEGPILPQHRKNLEFPGDNESPLGLLVNAFRRLDPGTKNLSIPNNISKEFLGKFRNGDPEYQDDTHWYKAAQEQDDEQASGSKGSTTPVNPGAAPSDNPDDYAPSQTPGTTPAAPIPATPPAAPQSSTLDELLKASEKVVHLSKEYTYDHKLSPFKVAVHKVSPKTGILVNGERLPCVAFPDGTNIDFFYNPAHPFLSQFPVSPPAPHRKAFISKGNS